MLLGFALGVAFTIITVGVILWSVGGQIDRATRETSRIQMREHLALWQLQAMSREAQAQMRRVVSEERRD